MKIPKPFLFASTAALALFHAEATLLVHEPFLTGGAPNYTVDATIKNTAPTSTGFTGNWSDPSLADAVDFRVRGTSLAYANDQTLDVSGGALEHYRSSGSAAAKNMNRALSYAMPQNSELWGSFLFTYSSGTAFTFSLTYGSGQSTRPFDFILASNTLTAAPGGAVATDVQSGTLSPDTTYMALFKAVDSTGGPSSVYDAYTFWINPVVTNTEGDLGASLGSGFGVIRELTAVNGTSANYTGASLVASLAAGQSFKVDEIRLGTSLADVMPYTIPEPGTLALLGIALGSLLLFRRRPASGTMA